MFEGVQEAAALDHTTINAIEVNDYEVVTPIQAIEVIDPLVVAPEVDPIITTSNEIAQMEVIAEQVSPHSDTVASIEEVSLEDDFVFNEVNTALNEIEVFDHELIESGVRQQIQFEFELPFKKRSCRKRLKPPLKKQKNLLLPYFS